MIGQLVPVCLFQHLPGRRYCLGRGGRLWLLSLVWMGRIALVVNLCLRLVGLSESAQL